mgnify:CR=1 FL=1
MKTVVVATSSHSYPIRIARRLIQDSDIIRPHLGRKAAIVTNTTVAELYLKTVENMLGQAGVEFFSIILPDGEQYKNHQSLNQIYDELLAHHAERSTTLIALGGGVVGDISGFAAATYQRGMPFIQIPTTLLSQVDSSVGGKTGINHPLGKNMIGAFYQPQRVVCDLDALKTLPARELSAGLAEVIKYGPIADMDFLAWLEAQMPALRACEPQALAHAVRRSCEIKAAVVGADEREAGLRAILNFGHTFGHAIEAGMGYGKWLHGEAVGAGMVMAATLSQELGLADAAFTQRLGALIEAAGLPTRGPVLDAADNAGRYLELMRLDKKAQAGEIRFVLIGSPGQAVVRSAPEALVRQVIGRCCGQ